jgi:predicted GNAT family N-acyltransferase
MDRAMEITVRFASNEKDLDAGYALRRAVFEVEQGVPRPLDRDPLDFNADHVVAYDGEGNCVGTGRIVRLDSRTCQVGRQVTAASVRGMGVGAQVLEYLERMASLRGLAEIIVHAQLPAEPFYARHGFVKEGGVFQEQGVPHVLMRKRLPR